MRTPIASVSLALCCLTASATAQGLKVSTSADSLAAVTAALVRAEVDLLSPKSRRVFSSRVAQARGGEWSASNASNLAQAIKATVAADSEEVSCGATVASCRMPAGVDLISTSKLRVEGDSAIVVVQVTRKSGIERIPIALRANVYMLVRQGAGWVVARLASSMVS